MRVIGRGQVLLAADHGAVTTASLYLNAICSPPAWRQGTSRNEFDPSRIVAPGAADKSESAMDILAGMLAYLAGIGVIFGGLALSLLLFTATPKQPLTPQSPVATAMRVAPNAAAKTPDAQANAKHPDSRSEKLGKYAPPAARPPDAARLQQWLATSIAISIARPRRRPRMRGGWRKRSAPAAGPISGTRTARPSQVAFSVTLINARQYSR